MDLEDFIIAVFCLTDDFVRATYAPRQLRQRGPAPALADSEVLTMESVGAFLGLATDQALYGYFRHHFRHFFPALARVHRTTFLRQAANLGPVKQALWQQLAAATDHDRAVGVVDSLPVPACRFARAYRCRRLPALAAYGYDALAHQTYYGVRLHVRIAWPGVITAAAVTPANAADSTVAPQLLAGCTGWALGDRAYARPPLQADLAAAGLALCARARRAGAAPWPRWLVQARRRIETVLSQLTERYAAKRVWARDPWHLAGRCLRILLSHTLAVLLCQQAGLPPLAFAKLLKP